ncbi:MAG TPA: type I DNA topoisomerase [Candidatus Glassbacteria bacterium]|nr:type I DNA topoisomerase [Candidatus Glassbacteria bacterium]
MGKNLVIVESPAKARTLGKYLGKDYSVKASMGHIIDLPENKLGVDLENDFQPSYEVIKGKKKIIGDLKKAAKEADAVFLAPDPDREGEAIAWHLAGLLDKSGEAVHRVLFNEITQTAVLEAMSNPQPLNRNLFEAQQARRILDRIVGYKISPLLWKVIRSGLSAGRVQSVAVRMVCEREEEIRAYVQKEYWSVLAGLATSAGAEVDTRLWSVDGKRVLTRPDDEADRDDRHWIRSEPAAGALADEIKAAGSCTVTEVERKEKKRNPQPPFITSTMQREAAVRFGWPARKTMQVAQSLYEGVELGAEGAVGLITYMRTDSTRVAEVALADARKLIATDYGDKHLPAKANHYARKSGGKVQDAHEAIRPTSALRRPSALERHLTPDQFKLYRLVWARFIASQMKPAIYDQTTVDFSAGNRLVLRAVGSVMKFSGFTAVYTEHLEKNGSRGENGEDEDRLLPELNRGDRLAVRNVEPRQHFTQPPSRYTESSLIRELEANGIGRPSTYASIMGTILDKGYVERIKGSLKPTELGITVNRLLVERFPGILNVKFTAQMEGQLDEVEEGSREWQGLLKEFYNDFAHTLEKAEQQRRRVAVETEIPCDKCGKPMVIRWSRHGAFLGCSSFPACSNTKQFERDENGKIRIVEEELSSEKCDKCGHPLVKKNGRYGPFLACSNYPACTNIRAITTGVRCPREGCDGELVEKKTKRGKTFYSCNRFPTCNYATWDRPLEYSCPSCGARPVFEKIYRGGKTGPVYCPSCKGQFKEEDLMKENSGGSLTQSA